MFEFIDCNPFFWRTLRSRDHVTGARYFQIFYVSIIVDAYKFFIHFFLARVFGNFIPRFLPLYRLIYSH